MNTNISPLFGSVVDEIHDACFYKCLGLCAVLSLLIDIHSLIALQSYVPSCMYRSLLNLSQLILVSIIYFHIEINDTAAPLISSPELKY